MLCTRMSRLVMWPISWAMTPRSSSGDKRRMMPWVTATTACCGFLPVAKALGESSGIRQMRGLGMPAFLARSSTMACSMGASECESSLALYIVSTILSENQYDPTFIIRAKPKAIISPERPPMA